MKTSILRDGKDGEDRRQEAEVAANSKIGFVFRVTRSIVNGVVGHM